MKVNWIIYFWDSASLCSSDYPWILHLSASNSWGLGFQSFTTTSVSFTFEEWKFHISFTSAELSSPSSGKKTWSLKITSYFYSFFFTVISTIIESLTKNLPFLGWVCIFCYWYFWTTLEHPWFDFLQLFTLTTPPPSSQAFIVHQINDSYEQHQNGFVFHVWFFIIFRQSIENANHFLILPWALFND